MTKNNTNQSAVGNNEVGGNLVIKGHLKQDSRDYSINMKLVEKNSYVFATLYPEETYLHDEEKYFGLRKIERVAVDAYNWFTAHIDIIFDNSYPNGELNKWNFEYVEELSCKIYSADYITDFGIDFSIDFLPDNLPDNSHKIGIYNPHTGKYHWRIRLFLEENGNVRHIESIKNTCPVSPGDKTPNFLEVLLQLGDSFLEETFQVIEQGCEEITEGLEKNTKTIISFIDSLFDDDW